MDTSNQNGNNSSTNGLSATPTNTTTTTTTPVVPLAEEPTAEVSTPPSVPSDTPIVSTPTESSTPSPVVSPLADTSMESTTPSPTVLSSPDATVLSAAEAPVPTPAIDTTSPTITPPETIPDTVVSPSAPIESPVVSETPAMPGPISPAPTESIPAAEPDDSMAATIAVAPPTNTSETSGAATSGSVAVSYGGSKKGMIMALLTVILLAGLAVGAYFMFMQAPIPTPAPLSAKKVTNAPTISPTLPPVDQEAVKASKDTSDAQLTKDTDRVDAAMHSLDSSTSSVDAGLADKPVSLN
ncbi:hypothetical protein BH11PAT1_BH11PAT1_0370 [soil metagenome]